MDSIQWYDQHHPYQNKIPQVIQDTLEPVLDWLPNEILAHIVHFMHPETVTAFSVTNKRNRVIVDYMAQELLMDNFAPYLDCLVAKSTYLKEYLMLYRYPFIVLETRNPSISVTIPKIHNNEGLVWFPTLNNIRYPSVKNYFAAIHEHQFLYYQYHDWYKQQLRTIITTYFSPDPFPNKIANILLKLSHVPLKQILDQSSISFVDHLVRRRLSANLKWIYSKEPTIISDYLRFLRNLSQRKPGLQKHIDYIWNIKK